MDEQGGAVACATEVRGHPKQEFGTGECDPEDSENGVHTHGTGEAPSEGLFPRTNPQGLPVSIEVVENTESEQRSQAEQFLILDQNGQPLHYESVVILTGQSENGQVYVIPSNQLERAQVLLPQGQPLDTAETAGTGEGKLSREELQTIAVTAISDSSSGLTMMEPAPVTPAKMAHSSSSDSPDVFTTPLQPLPPNAPSWAHRLRNCEKIGESYRGFCATEAELEAVLTLHKQHTHSVFGTRQSPSPAKPATRLMWKSQYVPYDGIPFVNAGSRAIVMECQFGPRRKGFQPKKTSEQENGPSPQYKATCPARIYIKKVRKFPEYRVPTDPKVDKKVVRQEQEKAFFNLKKSLWDAGGVLRFYIQLPTQKAHLYHDVDTPMLPPPPVQLPQPNEEEEEDEEEEEEEGGEGEREEEGGSLPSRLHPRVAEKICQLVALGHHQVYTVRKQLRKFVEREMFKSDEVPERHNLCYFPTVNDIKNHIHEAQKSLTQSGLSYSAVGSVDTQWTAVGSENLTETVTLTPTPTPSSTEVSRKPGVLEGSDTLCPEAMQLFSSLTSLQPKIFAQLRGSQLPPGPPVLDPSPTQFLQPSGSLEGVALSDTAALLGMGQLVSVSVLGDGVQHTLMGDTQAVPMQIVQPASMGQRSPNDQEETIYPAD